MVVWERFVSNTTTKHPKIVTNDVNIPWSYNDPRHFLPNLALIKLFGRARKRFSTVIEWWTWLSSYHCTRKECDEVQQRGWVNEIRWISKDYRFSFITFWTWMIGFWPTDRNSTIFSGAQHLGNSDCTKRQLETLRWPVAHYTATSNSFLPFSSESFEHGP